MTRPIGSYKDAMRQIFGHHPTEADRRFLRKLKIETYTKTPYEPPKETAQK
jgi:hypothetical protein